MTEKSVFREAWSPELTSQSFPVSCFWCHGFVPDRKWNLTLLAHQNTGKENRYRKKFFATLISTLGRFKQANKKKSVIYTLNSYLRWPNTVFESDFPPPCFDVPKVSNFTSGGVQNRDTKNRRLGTIGLQASRKTDFSVIFLLWANQFAKKWYNSALFMRK